MPSHLSIDVGIGTGQARSVATFHATAYHNSGITASRHRGSHETWLQSHQASWGAMVQPGLHLEDGGHYTSAGYAIRARAIAQALAKAFPANKHDSGCVAR